MTRHKLSNLQMPAKHGFARRLAPLALMIGATFLGGCATIDGAHVAATPWGAGGLYSFKDNLMKPRLQEPNPTRVDAQVAQALDRAEAQNTEDTRVASR